MASLLIVAACGDDDDDDDDDDDAPAVELLNEQGVCFWACDFGSYGMQSGCYQPVYSDEECEQYADERCGDGGAYNVYDKTDFHCTSCADKTCKGYNEEDLW